MTLIFYLINVFGHSGSSAKKTKHALVPKFEAILPIPSNTLEIKFNTITPPNPYIKHFCLMT